MKAVNIAFCILLVLEFANSQEAASLPPNSQEMITKLEEWEAGERALLETRISEKRKAVVEVLKRHLNEVTKTGDLDSALAIKTKIESLSSDALPPIGDRSSGTPRMTETKSLTNREKAKIDGSIMGTWCYFSDSGIGGNFTIKGEGRANRALEKWSYSIEKDGSILLRNESKGKTAELRWDPETDKLEGHDFDGAPTSIVRHESDPKSPANKPE